MRRVVAAATACRALPALRSRRCTQNTASSRNRIARRSAGWRARAAPTSAMVITGPEQRARRAAGADEAEQALALLAA